VCISDGSKLAMKSFTLCFGSSFGGDVKNCNKNFLSTTSSVCSTVSRTIGTKGVVGRFSFL